MTTRKNIIIIFCLTLLLSGCRNNAQPGSSYGPDQMLNQYLFGPISFHMIMDETSPEGIESNLNSISHSI